MLPRQQNHRHSGIHRLDPLQNLVTRHSRHLQIRDDQLRPSLRDPSHQLVRIGRSLDFQAHPFQIRAKNLLQHPVIVNHRHPDSPQGIVRPSALTLLVIQHLLFHFRAVHRLHRQSHPEFGTLVQCTLQLQLAPQQFHPLQSHRQPQPGTFHPGLFLAHPDKFLENPLLIRLGNPPARIPYHQRQGILRPVHPELHETRIRVLDRVRQQVPANLPDPQGIALEPSR